MNDERRVIVIRDTPRPSTAATGIVLAATGTQFGLFVALVAGAPVPSWLLGAAGLITCVAWVLYGWGARR